MKKINIKCFFPTDNGHLRLVVVFKLILKTRTQMAMTVHKIKKKD